MSNKIILVTDDRLSQIMTEKRKKMFEAAGYEVEVKSLWQLEYGSKYDFVNYDELASKKDVVELFRDEL